MNISYDTHLLPGANYICIWCGDMQSPKLLYVHKFGSGFTLLVIVLWITCIIVHQRQHKNFASLAFSENNYTSSRWNIPKKGAVVMQKALSCNDIKVNHLVLLVPAGCVSKHKYIRFENNIYFVAGLGSCELIYEAIDGKMHFVGRARTVSSKQDATYQN